MISSRPSPILSVSNLYIQRSGVVILDHLNWKVQHGEHWVILGANGAGKTSLLNAITGYLAPFHGVVTLLGETHGKTDWRELRKKVGIITSRMREHITDNEFAIETVVSGHHAMLDYWGHITPEERQSAIAVMTQLGIEHLVEREWRMLSQGERQRVLIARALVSDPAMLILDESCAGLDPIARWEFLDFVDTLTNLPDGPTIVTVTHHVEEITPGFTHALLLKNGTAPFSGPISETLSSENLSEVFEEKVALQCRDGGYLLSRS